MTKKPDMPDPKTDLTEDEEMRDVCLEGNERIDKAIARLNDDRSLEALTAVLDTIRERMLQNGHFLFPTGMKADAAEFFNAEELRVGDVVTVEKPLAFEICTVETADGKKWMAAFTNGEEYEKGKSVDCLFSQFIGWILDAVLKNENVEGIIINPWGQSLTLSKELVSVIMKPGIMADGAAPVR